jgi:hypothetical protein
MNQPPVVRCLVRVEEPCGRRNLYTVRISSFCPFNARLLVALVHRRFSFLLLFRWVWAATAPGWRPQLASFPLQALCCDDPLELADRETMIRFEQSQRACFANDSEVG